MIRGKTFLYAKKEYSIAFGDVTAQKYKYTCSKCGKSTYLGSEYDFCPYCGRAITGVINMERMKENLKNGEEGSV